MLIVHFLILHYLAHTQVRAQTSGLLIPSVHPSLSKRALDKQDRAESNNSPSQDPRRQETGQAGLPQAQHREHHDHADPAHQSPQAHSNLRQPEGTERSQESALAQEHERTKYSRNDVKQLQQQMVKHQALWFVQHQMPLQANQAAFQAEKRYDLPWLKRRLRLDRHMAQVRSDAWRDKRPLLFRNGDAYFRLHPHEHKQLVHIGRAFPVSEGPSGRAHEAMSKAQAKANDFADAASALESAGLPVGKPHAKPPRVKKTPRADWSNAWHDANRAFFPIHNSKLRSAYDSDHMREGTFNMAFDRPSDLDRLGTPWAYKHGPDPPQGAMRSTAEIRKHRKDGFLPRSMSDQTKEVFDKWETDEVKAYRAAEARSEGSRKVAEAMERPTLPTLATWAENKDALTRAHSIGYFGEVSSQNDATRNVNDFGAQHQDFDSPRRRKYVKVPTYDDLNDTF